MCGARRLAWLPPSAKSCRRTTCLESRGTYRHTCFSPTPCLTRRGEGKQAALGRRALLPCQAGPARGVALGSGQWGGERRRLCLAGSLPIGPCLLPLDVCSARGRKWGTGEEGTQGSRPRPESHPQRANVPLAPTLPAPCSQPSRVRASRPHAHARRQPRSTCAILSGRLCGPSPDPSDYVPRLAASPPSSPMLYTRASALMADHLRQGGL